MSHFTDLAWRHIPHEDYDAIGYPAEQTRVQQDARPLYDDPLPRARRVRDANGWFQRGMNRPEAHERDGH